MSAIRSMSLLPNQLRRPSDHSASSTAQEVLQKIDLNKPLYQGRVFKQKKEQKLNGFNGFNKRYFVLYPGVLLYYEHERDYHEDLKLGMVRCMLQFSLTLITYLNLIASSVYIYTAKTKWLK